MAQFRRCPALLLCLLLVVATTGAMPPTRAQAAPGRQALVVVLCKFTDRSVEPHPVAYYQDMVSETGAGKMGLFDYWRTVSYGRADLTGSIAKGWYTADATVAEFDAMPRSDQMEVCAVKAEPDVDYTKFAGLVVLTNHTNLQGPLFGSGQPGITIGGTYYPNLGYMASEEDVELGGILHESAHSLRIDHSRTLTPAITTQPDYGDLYDIGSCWQCYLGSPSYQGRHGPGLNAVQLDTAGWLAAERTWTFNPSTDAQRSVPIAALNHPEAAGFLQARIPAAVPIKKETPGGDVLVSTTSDYYSVELRSKSGFDKGIPEDAFILHLKGKDGRSYWVNAAGALTPGSEFVDAAHSTFIAVNSIDRSPASLGVVTVGSRQIEVDIEYAGQTRTTQTSPATLKAVLHVRNGATPLGGTPIPNVPVTLSVGDQSCTATTDRTGTATCRKQLDETPGDYPIWATFAGTAAYSEKTVTYSTPFTIEPG